MSARCGDVVAAFRRAGDEGAWNGLLAVKITGLPNAARGMARWPFCHLALDGIEQPIHLNEKIHLIAALIAPKPERRGRIPPEYDAAIRRTRIPPFESVEIDLHYVLGEDA